MFETFEKRSYESANGGRILKGKNNFGGSGLADVKVNSGAYLKLLLRKQNTLLHHHQLLPH